MIDKEDLRIGNFLYKFDWWKGIFCIDVIDESDFYFYLKKRKREGDKKEKGEEDVNVF